MTLNKTNFLFSNQKCSLTRIRQIQIIINTLSFVKLEDTMKFNQIVKFIHHLRVFISIQLFIKVTTWGTTCLQISHTEIRFLYKCWTSYLYMRFIYNLLWTIHFIVRIPYKARNFSKQKSKGLP